MKRRLTFWMILLFAPTLILLSVWMSEYSFETAMRREQERVQMTEAFIAPQVQETVSRLKYEGVVQAARQYRRVYAAQGIELIFCYNRMFLKLGIDPQSMERCYWMTPHADESGKKAYPAYRVKNTYLNAITGEWLQVASTPTLNK